MLTRAKALTIVPLELGMEGLVGLSILSSSPNFMLTTISVAPFGLEIEGSRFQAASLLSPSPICNKQQELELSEVHSFLRSPIPLRRYDNK